MSDKPLTADIKYHITEYLGSQLDHFVAVMITVVIIVGFKIIQIRVTEGERRPHIQMMPYLPLDYRCPRKLRRRIHRDISAAPLNYASYPYLNQAVYPLAMNELLRAIFKCRHH